MEKMEMKENGGIPFPLLLFFSLVAGLTVANLYYSQPLLDVIRQDMGIKELAANYIPMFTQIGYAVGLLFIIPLGDLYSRKRIVLVTFILLIVSLTIITFSRDLHFIYLFSFLTGVCSIIPQVFIPIASQYSTPETKSRNVGIVLSGLLIGILASRVVSGLVGGYFGWRIMYGIASCLMILCCLCVVAFVPDFSPNFKGSYFKLMKSLSYILKDRPVILFYSLRAAFAFGSFLSLWSCLAFRMAQAPYYAGSRVVGLLGICGMAGATTASFAGKYIRRVGVRNFNIIGTSLILFAWVLLFAGQNSYIGLIAGIVVIDIGMQCIQLTNQSTCLSLVPKASNRVNTLFMTTYFIGGAMGTFLSGWAWHLYGWTGVCCTAAFLILFPFLWTLFFKK